MHDALDDRDVWCRPLVLAAWPVLVLLMGGGFIAEAIGAKADRAVEAFACVQSGGTPILSGKVMDHHLVRCKR